MSSECRECVGEEGNRDAEGNNQRNNKTTLDNKTKHVSYSPSSMRHALLQRRAPGRSECVGCLQYIGLLKHVSVQVASVHHVRHDHELIDINDGHGEQKRPPSLS
eukprot:3553069-Amphidinium_carterae.1